MKKTVRRIFNKFGLDIVRYPSSPAPGSERAIKRPFNVLDFIVRDALAREPNFFFVQVGANDGVRWDPIHAMVCDYHLSGLLIEPLPDIFEQLKKNYSTEPQLFFEAAALAEKDGYHKIFRVKPDAPVGDWAQGIASFSRSHLVNHLRGELAEFEQYIEEVMIPTISVPYLIRKHSIKNITLLQIDTEGFDLQILKMFFGAGMRPEVINFERVNLGRLDQRESRQLLIDNDYRFIDVGIDTLAVHASSSRPSEPEDEAPAK